MSDQDKKSMGFKEFYALETLDELVLLRGGGPIYEVLHEGKWISGRFDRNIRIDHATHGAGQTHGHVLGRKRQELGVVNFDGTGSHGTKMLLHPDDAAALRAQGFAIPNSRIIEWTVLDGDVPQLLLG